jgi:ribosomal protein L40E
VALCLASPMSRVKFVKYCPLCGAENPERASMCQSCFKGDLTRTRRERPRDEEQDSIGGAGVPPADGEDTGQRPAPPAQNDPNIDQPAANTCRLELVQDPTVSFTVADGQIVGRTDKADVILKDVPQADYIHGRHAKLFRRGQQWYAQYLGGFNFIRVDNVEYRGNEEVAINDGSVLVLSLTPFYVRMGGG